MKILGMGVPELLILLLMFAFGYASMTIAKKKGYSAAGFFCLGLFLGVIGLIIALCIPSRLAAESQDNADTLLKYKKLLDEGVITQDEFDAKKAELM